MAVVFNTNPKWIVVFVAGAIIAIGAMFTSFPGRPSLPLNIGVIG